MKSIITTLFTIFYTTGWIVAQSTSEIQNSQQDSLKNSTFIIAMNAGMESGARTAELFAGKQFTTLKSKMETNIGYNYRVVYDQNYLGFMNFYSHNLFVEANYFFAKRFYGGLRFAVNYNKVTDESAKDIAPYNTLLSPTFYGFSSYTKLGYFQPIGKHFGIRLQAQWGMQYFKLKYIPFWYDSKETTENEYIFSGGLTLGLCYKL